MVPPSARPRPDARCTGGAKHTRCPPLPDLRLLWCDQRTATATTARGAGGGLSSPIWRQILADVLNIGIRTTSTSIGAARGAAILAGMGTNLYTDPDRGINWSAEPVTSPDPSKRLILDRAYRDYVDLYPYLREAYISHRR